MEAENRNKRFCSNKCRVYWWREKVKVKVPQKETAYDAPPMRMFELDEVGQYHKLEKKQNFKDMVAAANEGRLTKKDVAVADFLNYTQKQNLYARIKG